MAFKKVKTLSGKVEFKYSGSVPMGTLIMFGKGSSAFFSRSDYQDLTNHFYGKNVSIGASHSKPKAGTIDRFIQDKGFPSLASYIAPILIKEGFAIEGGAKSKIKLTVRFEAIE